ncbi:MAG TPA: Trp family transcriptional regulator [Deltaproteobacteria bacterium]|nr:Trp family transcriptional regulator [Deltaproteobacteria bacterium]HQI80534.1 Trp family transcriptional regulator [Deltaproteobacteria bacterium]
MKIPRSPDESAIELEKVFAGITDYDEMKTFFEEIFTPKELRDLALRWQLLKELHEGKTQRDIAARYRISLCKITRGSKVLKKRNSSVRRVLDGLYGKGRMHRRGR